MNKYGHSHNYKFITTLMNGLWPHVQITQIILTPPHVQITQIIPTLPLELNMGPVAAISSKPDAKPH